jgi:hypothetical protein
MFIYASVLFPCLWYKLFLLHQGHLDEYNRDAFLVALRDFGAVLSTLCVLPDGQIMALLYSIFPLWYSQILSLRVF